MDFAEERMGPDVGQGVLQARAMELANLGVTANADCDYKTAVRAMREALDYAEQHLPGDDIIPWIRSGLGSYLLNDGDYRGAVEMASAALAFCAARRAPLAALTMAKALLWLGDVTRAREYARQAHDLRGEAVLKAFSSVEREALGSIPT